MAGLQAVNLIAMLRMAAAHCTREVRRVEREIGAGAQLSHEAIGERMASAALEGLERAWRGETTPPPADPDRRPLPPKLSGITNERRVSHQNALQILRQAELVDTCDHPELGCLFGFDDGKCLRLAGEGRMRYTFGDGIWEERQAEPTVTVEWVHTSTMSAYQ